MMIFDAASLHTAVTETLNEAPVTTNARNAFVLVATTTGVKAVITTRVNDVWSIEGMVGVAKGTKLEAGIQIMAVW